MMDARTFTENLGGCWRNGQGQAPCPVCQPERRRDQSALSVSEGSGKTLLYCFKGGCSFIDIANASGVDLKTVHIDLAANAERKARRAEYTAQKLAKARSLWDYAKPIHGTKAERYLRGRRITSDLPESLRFVGDIYHQPSTTWGCAMVANVEPTGGVHRTFFDKSGKRLANDEKLMLGPCSGGAVRLSQVAGAPLVVCEGIETGLSLLSGLLSGPANVWATLSTSGMRGLTLPVDSGMLTIATDGDHAGTEAGNKLAMRATALGWDVSLLPAPDGKDWNDVLIEEGRAA